MHLAKSQEKEIEKSRRSAASPIQIIKNTRMLERITKEARRMAPGSVRRFRQIGDVKCLPLPKKQMKQSPCEHCAFRILGRKWCLSNRFCMSPERPDHRSVYFLPCSQEDKIAVKVFQKTSHPVAL